MLKPQENSGNRAEINKAICQFITRQAQHKYNQGFYDCRIQKQCRENEDQIPIESQFMA
jgi:hypothetical protein